MNTDKVLKQIKEKFFEKVEIQEEWHKNQVKRAYKDSVEEVLSDILKRMKDDEKEVIRKYIEEKKNWREYNARNNDYKRSSKVSKTP